jgi:hypothetical protein
MLQTKLYQWVLVIFLSYKKSSIEILVPPYIGGLLSFLLCGDDGIFD